MARNETTSRVLRVIHILEVNPAGISARDIHTRLSDEGFLCTIRTLYRDLEAIQAAYFPIVQTGDGADTKWRLESIATLNNKIQFSYQELMALFLAKSSLDQLKGSGIYPHIANFFTRLEKALGQGAEQELDRLRDYMKYKPQATWQSGVSQEILDTVYDACAESHILEVQYKSKSGNNKDKVTTRKLGPEGMYFADSGVYLIALDLTDNQHKTFSVSRILEAKMTDEHYQSNNFDLTNFVKDSIGVLRLGEVTDIELFVADPLAAYVSERRWHESQKVTRVDGGVKLKMRVRVNDELSRWVLSLGPSAQVIAPLALKDSVIAMATAIANPKVKKSA
jgi:predicted DNA-binding transcriptional regulator YafY